MNISYQTKLDDRNAIKGKIKKKKCYLVIILKEIQKDFLIDACVQYGVTYRHVLGNSLENTLKTETASIYITASYLQQ